MSGHVHTGKQKPCKVSCKAFSCKEIVEAQRKSWYNKGKIRMLWLFSPPSAGKIESCGEEEFSVNVADKRSHFRLHADTSAARRWREIFLKEHQMKYPKRTRIIEQGEHTSNLYYIIDGIVEYTHTDKDGVENLIEAIGPGSMVGIQPFVQKAPATGSFIALTDVVAATLYQDQVYAHIKRDSLLATELMEELCKMINGLVTQLFAHTKSADDRIREIICALCETGMSTRKNEYLFIGLSQSELARITRTTRTTTAKVLSKLKSENYLDTVYGGIIVKDYNKLKQLVTMRKP